MERPKFVKYIIRALRKLWHYCSWNSLKRLWTFSSTPGPREALIKSLLICIISSFSNGKQIAGYWFTTVIYNRFYLNDVQKTFKAYMIGWLPAFLPSRACLRLLLQFFTIAFIQINAHYAEIACTFIKIFLCHLTAKVIVCSLIALYTLITRGFIDVSLINNISSYFE